MTHGLAHHPRGTEAVRKEPSHAVPRYGRRPLILGAGGRKRSSPRNVGAYPGVWRAKSTDTVRA
uniref:P.syringae pPS10 plasmid DNA for basic replicon n=1 Tax=Pseudomonas syringae TaxID=317 RepID=Q52547_PSESX|nr:unnamed protein product [Pseudomonas syringae]